MDKRINVVRLCTWAFEMTMSSEVIEFKQVQDET